MYKDTSQLKIEDFVFPYGNLDPENDWVKLAGLVPWETAEERYAAQFADNGAPNGGTLVLDATCCPAGIAYPQDVNLLNQKREKLEKTVDEICESTGEKKPRMYHQLARRDFLRLSKSKKRNAKSIHSAIKKQLQYIRRDIGYIVQFVQNGIFLSSTYIDSLTDADSVLLSAHTSAYRDCQSVLHQRIQCPHLVMDVSLYSDCLKRPLFADATL